MIKMVRFKSLYVLDNLCSGFMNNMTMIAFTQLTPKQLRKAATIQERIVSLQDRLNDVLGAQANGGAPQKRRMSAAGRAAIAAAARARWARHRRKKVGTATAKKRKMSASGRARLSALAKARWKQAKASGKARL
jgi:hypothetical protein